MSTKTNYFDGAKIREAREELGWSRPELVLELHKLGLTLSESTIVRWEDKASAPGADDLVVLAEALQKPLRYFFATQPDRNAKVING